MHAQRELRRLAARKAALIAELDRSRAESNDSAARLLGPFELIDRVLELWRRVVPLAGSAAGSATDAGARPAPTRSSRVGTWLRWISLGIGVVRVVRGAPERRSTSARRGNTSESAEAR